MTVHTSRPASLAQRLAAANRRWRPPIRVGAVLLATSLTAAAAQFTCRCRSPRCRSRSRRWSCCSPARRSGRGSGALAQVLYLAAGTAGLPVFAPSVDAAARRRALARPDGRLSPGVSGGGVRHRLARRARLGSALSHVAGRMLAGPRHHLRRRRLVARGRVFSDAHRGRPPPAWSRSSRSTPSRSRWRRRCLPAAWRITKPDQLRTSKPELRTSENRTPDTRDPPKFQVLTSKFEVDHRMYPRLRIRSIISRSSVCPFAGCGTSRREP